MQFVVEWPGMISFAPTGLGFLWEADYPPLKRWAIFGSPCETFVKGTWRGHALSFYFLLALSPDKPSEPSAPGAHLRSLGYPFQRLFRFLSTRHSTRKDAVHLFRKPF